MNAVAVDVRAAVPEDAAACARIVNDWIDGTEWMPRVHDHEDVQRHYRETVFAQREVLVSGQPVAGYIALDDQDYVTALFVATPGRGIGKALLDRAKVMRPKLNLWTFQVNTGARRFYAREGFREVEMTTGDNEEGLPDVRLEWSA
ncbi:MAG: GNAT family N-acetyltransferase [Pseudomonadota bacterium]